MQNWQLQVKLMITSVYILAPLLSYLSEAQLMTNRCFPFSKVLECTAPPHYLQVLVIET